MQDILGARKAVEIANLPDEDVEPFKDYPMDEVYELIHDFYKKSDSRVKPETYGISTDSESITTKTTLGRPRDGSLSIQSVESESLVHSHYAQDALEKAQIDVESSWNGDSAAVRYQDGNLSLVRTDYYTAATFSQLLYLETIQAYRDSDTDHLNPSDMPLREKFLHNYQDFCQPDWIARESSIGGVVIARDEDNWKIILGKRSEEPRVNPGLISIAPNGGVSYENLIEGGFEESLERQFSEEFFQGKYQMDFFNDYIEPYQVSAGWNLRDGTFALGYLLLVEDPEGYAKLASQPTHNFEFKEIVEIDVSNPVEIAETVNIDKMSPSTIPVVYRSLVAFNSMEKTPDLDYSILSG